MVPPFVTPPAHEAAIDTFAPGPKPPPYPHNPGPGEVCRPDGLACTDNTLCCTECCIPGTAPVCTVPDAYGECPLPDIFVDEASFLDSLRQDTYEAQVNGCAVEEGCVLGDGVRKVLRFTTTTPNLGTADLKMGDPNAHPESFEWSACHEHFHYKGFAEYRLYDTTGSVVLTGHKQAFCLMDAIPWFEIEIPTYHCANQGISTHWADSYGGDLDCQWVDVTDIAPGDYTLEVALNPDGVFQDRDPSNDAVRAPVTITP